MIRWDGTYQTVQRAGGKYLFIAVPAIDAMIENGPFLRIDITNEEALAVIMYNGSVAAYLEEFDLPHWMTWA